MSSELILQFSIVIDTLANVHVSRTSTELVVTNVRQITGKLLVEKVVKLVLAIQLDQLKINAIP